MTLPWVEDGMPVDEQEAVIQLLYIAQDRRMVLWELVHKPWIRDDLSATENQAIFLLASIVSVDEESAEHIVRMPFLDSIERDDLSILQTLEALDQEGLRWLLSHPGVTGGNVDVLPATMALVRLEWEWPGDGRNAHGSFLDRRRDQPGGGQRRPRVAGVGVGLPRSLSDACTHDLGGRRAGQ